MERRAFLTRFCAGVALAVVVPGAVASAISSPVIKWHPVIQYGGSGIIEAISHCNQTSDSSLTYAQLEQRIRDMSLAAPREYTITFWSIESLRAFQQDMKKLLKEHKWKV